MLHRRPASAFPASASALLGLVPSALVLSALVLVVALLGALALGGATTPAAAQIPSSTGRASAGGPASGPPQAFSAAPAAAATTAAPPQAVNAAPPQVGDDPFTVRGIAVDVTADSANAARDKAVAEAQRKAFAVLYRRLTLAAETQAAPSIPDRELARLVRGFEIEDERASAVRYVATLTVAFKPEAMRGFVEEKGQRVVEVPTRPFLILPVSRLGERTTLWEERTPWRQAWEERAATPGGLVPVAVPAGELADVADIGAAEALAGDATGLAKIATRYGAGEVVVAVINGRPTPQHTPEVDITRYRPDGAGVAEPIDVPPKPGERSPEFYKRAVAAVLQYIEAGIRAGDAGLVAPLPADGALVGAGPGGETRLLVTVPITRLEEWLEVRKRLGRVAGIIRAEPLSVARTQAELDLRYRGDIDRLKAALSGQGLSLAGGVAPGNPVWELRLTALMGVPTPLR
ncbi:conserved hypothetical protein [uncultured Gammaproteobacteria bacterium]